MSSYYTLQVYYMANKHSQSFAFFLSLVLLMTHIASGQMSKLTTTGLRDYGW